MDKNLQIQEQMADLKEMSMILIEHSNSYSSMQKAIKEKKC